MDEKFIALALNLAKKNLGLTAPNPVVGCVIVENGEILATGTTARGGRPHAETVALAKVADKARLQRATLYVTLEPCCHQGQTPPCVDAIIASGVKKVVIATLDICAKVNGGGVSALRQAGVDVVCSVLEKEAQEINHAFFKVQKTSLPFITLKLATSLDGKIATKSGASKWITDARARDFTHYLRAKNDAIMVGAGTLKKDNPALSCRLAGLEDHSPIKIIVSGNLNFDENFAVFQNGNKESIIIITSEDNAASHQEKIIKLQNAGAKIIFCNSQNGQINLIDALKKLAASGVNSILVEGGKNLSTQFLKQNLVDELIWISSNKIVGGDGVDGVGELDFVAVEEVLQNLQHRSTTKFGKNDVANFYDNFSFYKNA